MPDVSAMAVYTPPDHVDFIVEGMDPRYVGQTVTVVLEQMVRVLDDRPVHRKQVLYSHTMTLEQTDLIWPMELTAPLTFAYEGAKIRIEVVARIRMGSGSWFSRSTEIAKAVVQLPVKQGSSSYDDALLMQPHDAFQMWTNLEAVDPTTRLQVVIASGGYALAVGVGLWVASNIGFICVIVSGILAFMAGRTLYTQLQTWLKNYGELRFRTVGAVQPSDVVPIGQLLEGITRVAVRRPKLRVVASNLECGQYKRGSGTDVRTVSFQDPVSSVVLYEQEVDVWPADTPLNRVFSGEVRFAEAFTRIHPPLSIDVSHGLKVRWEAQLLAPELQDLEAEGPVETWVWPEEEAVDVFP